MNTILELLKFVDEHKVKISITRHPIMDRTRVHIYKNLPDGRALIDEYLISSQSPDIIQQEDFNNLIERFLQHEKEYEAKTSQ